MEQNKKKQFHEVETVLKGMNYTVPTYKLENGEIENALNITIKFFHEGVDSSIVQQGVDPRSLLKCVIKHLNETRERGEDLDELVDDLNNIIIRVGDLNKLEIDNEGMS